MGNQTIILLLGVVLFFGGCTSKEKSISDQTSNTGKSETGNSEKKVEHNSNRITDETSLPEIRKEVDGKIIAMWKLHKHTYKVKAYRADTMNTEVQYPDKNEFLNLMENKDFELKTKYGTVNKGIWITSYTLDKRNNTIGLLHLVTQKSSMSDESFKTYIFRFENADNVQYFVLDDLSSSGYEGGSYYYIREK